MTTCVGKPCAAILLGVVTSGECLRLIGAVVCLLAATAVQCPLARAVDGRICVAALLVLANQLPLPRLLKRAVLGLPSSAI